MKKTLLVMAAGMGSRFGGLKQIEPIGPNGEFLIDYSVNDALNNGFDKVVFVIRKENYDLFKNTIGKRVSKYIDVSYAFQNIEDVPVGGEEFSSREKPWGTGQAILCSKDLINEPFVIINADDFYGTDSFGVASRFIDKNKSESYAVLGYEVINTLSGNGSVKRAVLGSEGDDLISLSESVIEDNNGIITAKSLKSGMESLICSDTRVSVNMMVMYPNVFEILEKEFKDFLISNKDNINSCEFLIPDIISKINAEGINSVKVLSTKSKWLGVTYKGDTDYVKSEIKKLCDNGVYKEDLWNGFR